MFLVEMISSGVVEGGELMDRVREGELGGAREEGEAVVTADMGGEVPMVGADEVKDPFCSKKVSIISNKE